MSDFGTSAGHMTKMVDPYEAGRAAKESVPTPSIWGTVVEAGGGYFRVLVDRETENYPAEGERTNAAFFAPPKHQATQFFHTCSESRHDFDTVICDCGARFEDQYPSRAINAFLEHAKAPDA